MKVRETQVTVLEGGTATSQDSEALCWEDLASCDFDNAISHGADVLHECRRQGMAFEDAWHLAVEMVMRCAQQADGKRVDDSDLVAFMAYRPTYRASYHRLPQPVPAYDPKVRYDLADVAGSSSGYGGCRVETVAR